MENSIKLYRVVLNILFYIFYVLIISIVFSFVYPAIATLLSYQIVDIENRIFYISVQIIILVIVLVLSLIFRKFFYLPIVYKSNISKSQIKKENKIKKEKKVEKLMKKYIEKENDSLELDIKIGKEIK